MTFSDEDKTYIRNVVENLIASQNQAADKNGKEFHMHIYDALWENMRSKESRLWTFLSIYGAAVGLVFAGGQVSDIPGADLFAIVIVMALSTWAVLIILNANWWYYRNQLMVSRIENKYPDAVKGIVPKIYYENPTYRFDQLSQASILLLSLLLLLLYSRTIWSYHNAGSINTLQSLVVVVLLYILFILSAGFCLRLHESNIAAYYVTKKAILADTIGSAIPSVDDRLKLLKDETETRKSQDVRIYIFIFLAFVAVLFDLIIYRNGVTAGWLTVIIAVQALAGAIFLIQDIFYRRTFTENELKAATCDQQIAALENKARLSNKGKSRKSWQVWHMSLLVVISGALAGYAIFQNNQKLREDEQGAAISAADVGEKINKIQQDLESLQNSYNKLQQNNVQLQKQLLDEKLKPYTTRDEAEQRFMTKEAFNNFLKSQSQPTP
jgi:hypothetical protein